MSEDTIRENLVKNLKRGRLRQNLKVDLRTKIQERIRPSTRCEIDICFKTTDRKMIGIEVKDEVGYNEVLKGIGQAIGYLQYCHGSYIAGPEEYEEDLIQAIKNKTNVGLIVYSEKTFKLIHPAKISTPQNHDLISRLSSNGRNMWQTFERDNFLETIFIKFEKHSGKIKSYGKYGSHLLISSILNLMLRGKRDLHHKELWKITNNYFYFEYYKDFLSEYEQKWFSRSDIFNESKKACKKLKKYGKHSAGSIHWSLQESILAGIVETKVEKKKLLYRINPMFIPKIYELLKKWR